MNQSAYAAPINLTSIKPGTPGSKTGSHNGSFITSTSDIERMERLMSQAQHASKPIVKYFGKQLEEFRREQLYSKEIVLSDTQRGIPESMIKHAENFAPD
jgi:hypothetical protein